MTVTGAFTEYPLPTGCGIGDSITAGQDGALWFIEVFANKIGRITTSGALSEYAIPTAISVPHGITTGSDGAIWFTEFNGNEIGRLR
jgi:virginiamycin B lyase